MFVLYKIHDKIFGKSVNLNAFIILRSVPVFQSHNNWFALPNCVSFLFIFIYSSRFRLFANILFYVLSNKEVKIYRIKISYIKALNGRDFPIYILQKRFALVSVIELFVNFFCLCWLFCCRCVWWCVRKSWTNNCLCWIVFGSLCFFIFYSAIFFSLFIAF